MSKTVDKTHELFVAASLSDDDLGYPDRVAFIPGDQGGPTMHSGAISRRVAPPCSSAMRTSCC